MVAAAAPGFPCRVSLEEARVGEELLLLHHMHQPAHAPYRAAGPIYVRRGAVAARLAPGWRPARCRIAWPRG
ncbi:DUF1203 domain-containing protein [Stenotrophomonas sp. MMGLT7]|uniref:DUF1203 domain-containing protein n=1 Tax=Stenotrophomonas sp. MMGLT7 TaxID=2901227 RepID=UPI002F916EA6